MRVGEQIASDAKVLTKNILDRYKTGITPAGAKCATPEQVQAAFDDAVKANQDRERQINEGQAYYNDVMFLKQKELLLDWCNKLRVTVKELLLLLKVKLLDFCRF